MDNKTIFANNLKDLMALHKKSRSDVCRDLGISYYTFSDWVKGKKYPRMDKVEMLANYFGVLKSELIENKETPTVNDDGLSENMRKLIEFAKTVPEDKAALVLQVMKSIVEAE